MVHAHKNMGSNPQEAEALQEDNRKFEATAMVRFLVKFFHDLKLRLISELFNILDPTSFYLSET